MHVRCGVTSRRPVVGVNFCVCLYSLLTLKGKYSPPARFELVYLVILIQEWLLSIRSQCCCYLAYLLNSGRITPCYTFNIQCLFTEKIMKNTCKPNNKTSVRFSTFLKINSGRLLSPFKLLERSLLLDIA